MVSKVRKISWLLAFPALLFAALACNAAARAPAPAITSVFSEPSGGGGIPQSTPTLIGELPLVIQPTRAAPEPSAPAPAPEIPERRRLTLEYPPHIRTGDSDIVRLTLEVNDLGGLTPTAEFQGNVITGQTVEIPNVYETHDVVAEARLDLAGPDIRPSDAVDEPLLPGQTVTFFWSVRPSQAGMYRGTVWLFLRFTDKASGQESRKAVTAQTVQIESTNFLGLTGNVARATGGIGAIIGGVLGFPFADDILKWLWSRIRSQA
jgi:hypothetical protein